MANIRTGSIVSDLRGKVSSEIYSRNREGAYVKNYVVPVQPGTSFQVNAQDDMGDAIAAWQALTDAERMDWIVFAEKSPGVNKVGNSYNRAGYNLYVSHKMNLLSIGQTQEPTPVLVDPHLDYSASFNTLTDGAITVDHSSTDGTSEYQIIIYMSPPVSVGTMSPNTPRYDIIGSTAMNNSQTTGLLTPYQSRFGDLSLHIGEKVFLKTRIIRRLVDSAAGPGGPRSGASTAKIFHESAIIQEA